jgi:hypothetical protein
VLLGLLVRTFVASGPLVIGVDETLERRFGPKIAYTRDLPRPGALHPGALRKDEWSQVGVPDALGARAMGETRMWALPFLSVLAPSERYAAQRGKRHKKISDWARQALLLLRRWHPKREIVAVADSARTLVSSYSQAVGASCPSRWRSLLACARTQRSTILLHRAEPGRWADRA